MDFLMRVTSDPTIASAWLRAPLRRAAKRPRRHNSSCAASSAVHAPAFEAGCRQGPAAQDREAGDLRDDRDQQLVYKNLLQASQRKISDLVARNGFQRSAWRFSSPPAPAADLLSPRTAQAKDLDSQYPRQAGSFFELLDEAIDGGHRVLVFSQFTSMLAILKRELEKLGLTYSYLDGSRKTAWPL